MSEPTTEQLHSACLSYRHDYGLMTTNAQTAMHYTAVEWLTAWRKTLGEQLEAPRSLETPLLPIGTLVRFRCVHNASVVPTFVPQKLNTGDCGVIVSTRKSGHLGWDYWVDFECGVRGVDHREVEVCDV